MSERVILWTVFGITITTALMVDLGIVNRRAHTIGFREALGWSCVWIGLALLYNVLIYFLLGVELALKFLTGYIVEESLSVDNLFVFLIIFSYFRVPSQYQHRTLFWGILGAIIMRATFIVLGVSLINKFHFIIYLFGAFLIYTGFKTAFRKDEEIHPEKNWALKVFRKFMPVTTDYHNAKFFMRKENKYFATPLFIVLLVIETTDIIFALDSIPAILGISTDPLIVYSSNIFAILGLRTIFFMLSGIMEIFQYLKYGVSIVLIFIGLKMVSEKFVEIPISFALGAVAGILFFSIIASIIHPHKETSGKKGLKKPEN